MWSISHLPSGPASVNNPLAFHNDTTHMYYPIPGHSIPPTHLSVIPYSSIEMGRYRLQVYQCIMSKVSQYGDISLLKSIRSSSIYDY